MTAWKYCSILHIVLNEGKNMSAQMDLFLTNLSCLGKFWGTTSDEYGPCLNKYIKLLKSRIRINKSFSGYFMMNDEQSSDVMIV